MDLILSGQAKTVTTLTYSAVHEQDGMIQLSAAAKGQFLEILLQQIAESYLLANASLSKLKRPLCDKECHYLATR